MAAFFAFSPWEANVEAEYIIKADAELYHNHALKILNQEYPYSDRVSPGFPYLLAFVYFVFGIKPWLVLLLNIMFNVLNVYLVYKLAKLLFGGSIALISSALLTLDTHQIIFTQTLLTDTIFALLIVTSILFIVKSTKDLEVKNLIVAGSALGFAVLIRPIGVYFYIVAILLILLSLKHIISMRIFKSTVFLAAYILVLSPVILVNYINFDHIGVSRLGGLNFLYVNAMSVYEIQGGKSHEESIRIVDQKVQEAGGDTITGPVEKERLYFDVGMQIIRDNFFAYLINHINGSINIYTSLSTYNIARVLRVENTLLSEKFFGYPVYSQIGSFLEVKSSMMIITGLFVVIIMIFQYFTALAGGYYLFRQKKIIEMTILLLPVVYFTVVTGVVGNARFKLPITPFLLIFSAYGIYTTRVWYLNRKKSKKID